MTGMPSCLPASVSIVSTTSCITSNSFPPPQSGFHLQIFHGWCLVAINCYISQSLAPDGFSYLTQLCCCNAHLEACIKHAPGTIQQPLSKYHLVSYIYQTTTISLLAKVCNVWQIKILAGRYAIQQLNSVLHDLFTITHVTCIQL